MEVYNAFGPGLLESVYQKALKRELELRGHNVHTECSVPIVYKDEVLDTSFRLDLIVDNKVIIELKSVEVVLPVQCVVQRVANEFAGAGTGEHDVKILGLDHLIQELLQLLLAGGQLGTGLTPGGGLLVDLVDGEGRSSGLHLLFGVVENAHAE